MKMRKERVKRVPFLCSFAFGDPIFCFRTENRGKEPTKEALPLWNLRMFALPAGTSVKFASPAGNPFFSPRFPSAAAPIVRHNKAKKGASALFILQSYRLYLFAAFAIEALAASVALGG